MKFLLGVLSLAIGLEGLWSAIRHRRLRDKSGWIYARVERQPLYFWVMTAVFALLAGIGCVLIFLATTDVR